MNFKTIALSLALALCVTGINARGYFRPHFGFGYTVAAPVVYRPVCYSCPVYRPVYHVVPAYGYCRPHMGFNFGSGSMNFGFSI